MRPHWQWSSWWGDPQLPSLEPGMVRDTSDTWFPCSRLIKKINENSRRFVSHETKFRRNTIQVSSKWFHGVSLKTLETTRMKTRHGPNGLLHSLIAHTARHNTFHGGRDWQREQERRERQGKKKEKDFFFFSSKKTKQGNKFFFFFFSFFFFFFFFFFLRFIFI